MKHVRAMGLCWLLISVAGYVCAQDLVVKNHVYLALDVPFSKPHHFAGLGLGLNYVRNEVLSFQFSVTSALRHPVEMPKDAIYAGPTLYERMTMTALEAGRIVKLTKKGTIRLNLKGGLALMSLEIPTDWVPVEDPCQNCPNYTFTRKWYLTGGIVLRPTLELPVFTFVGLTAGPIVILAKGQTVFGGSAGLRFRLRTDPKKRQKDQ